jgi:hypothetical protein
MTRSIVVLAVVLAPLAIACAEEQLDVPGLDPADEIELIEVEPDPSSDSYIWTTAYQVEELPKLNVGHPTAEFLEDAARVDEDPEMYICVGDASGSGGCSVEDPATPSLSGITFGGPDVLAWSWDFVPEDTVAVRFIDQDGAVSWQRPLDRTVIFPNTVPADPEATCACHFEALDADGGVVAAVDLATSSYVGSDFSG